MVGEKWTVGFRTEARVWTRKKEAVLAAGQQLGIAASHDHPHSLGSKSEATGWLLLASEGRTNYAGTALPEFQPQTASGEQSLSVAGGYHAAPQDQPGSAHRLLNVFPRRMNLLVNTTTETTAENR